MFALREDAARSRVIFKSINRHLYRGPTCGSLSAALAKSVLNRPAKTALKRTRRCARIGETFHGCYRPTIGRRRQPLARRSRPRADHRHGGLQSLAGAAGGALHPSVHRHGLRLLRVLAAAVARHRDYRVGRLPGHAIFAELFTTTCDWKISELGWMFTLFFVVLGVVGGAVGRLARARRSAQGRRRRGAVLVRRPRARRHRRLHPPALGDVARLRRDRRHRPRPRLYLAGVDTGEMVSRTGAAWRPAWRSWASAAAP